MASLSEDAAEVKEGFLCPLCHKDLQSFYQLQEHYEEQHHTAEQRHVSAHIRSFVQKAKKAKDKLLKREGEERAESSYESFYYGGVDPYMWEPQELGATRSHMESFKKHRAARIDHYVIEVNKCIIRLEKLTSFDRTNMDVAQIRTLEKSVVSWVSDQDVPFCPDCGGKFNLRNRRHHCRLCGSIMCRKCTEFVPLPMAGKLISMTREALCAAPPPPALASGSSVAPGLTRRGSVSSISSVASMLEEKDEDRVRCCCHCMNLLIRRQDKLEEKEHVPDVVKLYQRLRACMEKVEVKAPEYTVMAESLCAGETGCTLDNAAGLRMEIQKYYELIDVLSKRILTLGLKDEVPPSPRALQLQRMVRHSSTLFIQEKLLGLTSLPSLQEYEELKEKRRLEQEKKLQREKQAALEAQMRQSEPEKNGAVEAPRLRKTGCWLPQSEQTPSSAEDDPLLQQIQNIHSFLRQARTADRADEVAMLEENLRQLQDEFDAQQTDRAIQMSRQLAEETELQHRHFQHLQQTQQAWSLAEEVQTTHTGTGPPERSSSPPGTNPFEEAEPSPDGETHVSNGKQPYNPFEEESEEQTPGNPFGDDDDEEEEDGGHASTNPFDEEDVNDLIEEELLLQQIDNIRAYMFDAKQSGRADEVELLSENLRHLQRTLQQQKHRK